MQRVDGLRDGLPRRRRAPAVIYLGVGFVDGQS